DDHGQITARVQQCWQVEWRLEQIEPQLHTLGLGSDVRQAGQSVSHRRWTESDGQHLAAEGVRHASQTLPLAGLHMPSIVETRPDTGTEQRPVIMPPWSVILHNDDDHDMLYVVRSLIKSVPNLGTTRATKIM